MKKKFKNLISIVKSLKTTLLFGALAGLPLIIVFIFYTLPYLQEYIHDSKAKALSSSIDNAYSVINNYYQNFQNGELTESEAKSMAFNSISYMRYGDGGYFFILNSKGDMALHPIKPKLNGVNMLNHKDPTGKLFFQEIITLSKNKGQGFVDYMWPKVGMKGPQPKLTYIKKFNPWDLVIGTGLYTDDVKKLADEATFKNLMALAIASLFMITAIFFSGFIQYKNVIAPVLDVIENLDETSEDVTNLAAEMSQAGLKLAESGEQQSSSIQETAATVDEITAMVNRNQDSAEKSKEATAQSFIDAKLGKQSMDDIICSIQQVETSYVTLMNQVETSNNEISDITQVIAQIVEKTKVINDIVFQTKLLSFNASVEAARAGQHGKGFAVVAEEIGNLANMSGNASKEISDMLDLSSQQVQEIVNKSNSNVKSIINTGKQKLDEAVTYATTGQGSMDKVLDNASTIDHMVSAIAEASREQALGVNEIQKAINELNQSTAENAVLATQSQKSSDDLNSGSHELKGIITKLKRTA